MTNRQTNTDAATVVDRLAGGNLIYTRDFFRLKTTEKDEKSNFEKEFFTRFMRYQRSQERLTTLDDPMRKLFWNDFNYQNADR